MKDLDPEPWVALALAMETPPTFLEIFCYTKLSFRESDKGEN